MEPLRWSALVTRMLRLLIKSSCNPMGLIFKGGKHTDQAIPFHLVYLITK